MDLRDRVPEIRRLLETALDCDEEYIYEGEMSYYPRTYAGDAAADLRMLFAARAPNEKEIAACVEEVSKPARRANGKSKRVLLLLFEHSRSIIEALAESSDASLRLFALEAGGQWTNPYFFSPLCSTVGLKIRLLDDPDAEVRLAAVFACSETVGHNMPSLGWTTEKQQDHWFARLHRRFFELLDDASPKIRAAAAATLGKWTTDEAQAALASRLGREDDPAVREILTRLIGRRTGESSESFD